MKKKTKSILWIASIYCGQQACLFGSFYYIIKISQTNVRQRFWYLSIYDSYQPWIVQKQKIKYKMGGLESEQINFDEDYFIYKQIYSHVKQRENLQNKGIEKLAFGSCNMQLIDDQPMWDVLRKEIPEQFIWLGDAVYLDRSLPGQPFLRFPVDKKTMYNDFLQQQSRKNYINFRDTVPIFGIWDDHDMGKNDADWSYNDKDITQDLFLNFLGIPKTINNNIKKKLELEFNTTTNNINKIYNEYMNTQNNRRKQKGVYNSFTLGTNGRRIKVILLDIRYYQNQIEGDILGNEQWNFLKKELDEAYNIDPNIGSDIIFIGSGIQIISWGKYIAEGWRSFPKSRDRLQNMITENTVNLLQNINAATSNTTVRSKPPGILLLSGDIHFAEFSQIYRCINITDKSSLNDTTYWSIPFFEVTSSGMTHAWSHLPSKIPSSLHNIFTSIIHWVLPKITRMHLTSFSLSKLSNKYIQDTAKPFIKKIAELKNISYSDIYNQLHNQPSFYTGRNVAIVDFDWDLVDPMVFIRILDSHGNAQLQYPLSLSVLRPFQISSPSSSSSSSSPSPPNNDSTATSNLSINQHCNLENKIRNTLSGFYLEADTCALIVGIFLLFVALISFICLILFYKRFKSYQYRLYGKYQQNNSVRDVTS